MVVDEQSFKKSLYTVSGGEMKERITTSTTFRDEMLLWILLLKGHVVVVHLGETPFNNLSSRYWMSMPNQPNVSKESRLLNKNKKRIRTVCLTLQGDLLLVIAGD